MSALHIITSFLITIELVIYIIFAKRLNLQASRYPNYKFNVKNTEIQVYINTNLPRKIKNVLIPEYLRVLQKNLEKNKDINMFKILKIELLDYYTISSNIRRWFDQCYHRKDSIANFIRWNFRPTLGLAKANYQIILYLDVIFISNTKDFVIKKLRYLRIKKKVFV
jgi:hypothetical protein